MRYILPRIPRAGIIVSTTWKGRGSSWSLCMNIQRAEKKQSAKHQQRKEGFYHKAIVTPLSPNYQRLNFGYGGTKSKNVLHSFLSSSCKNWIKFWTWSRFNYLISEVPHRTRNSCVEFSIRPSIADFQMKNHRYNPLFSKNVHFFGKNGKISSWNLPHSFLIPS